MIDINNKNTEGVSSFRRGLYRELQQYLLREANRYPEHECLKIDLHCHDHNSDVPDELWGRILGLPETWLQTKQLKKCLKKQDCQVFTVTNHNNARSCWEMMAKGKDVLVGAEFTCHFSEYDLYLHVLTYGFTPEQEVVLNDKRHDIYEFLRYTTQQDLAVILPHPLYFYSANEKIDLSLFEKLAVMFMRFEVLNGQRDIWQTVLTLNWARGLSQSKIEGYARKHNLNPQDFGVDPSQRKILSGGSDDHMGIFAGQCGSKLWVPNLQHRLLTSSPSELALEAIKQGRIAPFGNVAENHKLNIALLDYFSQVATNIKDPGLLRMLLHRGNYKDKMACFTISNLLLELQKHKNTVKFFNFIHDALRGKKPSKLLKWQAPKDYKFCIEYLERIAHSKQGTPEEYVETVNQTIGDMFEKISRLLIERIQGAKFFSGKNSLDNFSAEELIKKIEIPSQISALLFGGSSQANMSDVNVSKLLDSLSFPLLIGVLLLGSHLASTRLLYQNRQLLNEFSQKINKNQHPKRALYLTDTLRDKNGVSNSLSGKLKEIQRQDLPIDFLICHSDLPSEPHLHVLRPLTTFAMPGYSQQEIRLPNLLEIARIFYEGGYDRVVCSTEGPMALASLFLKQMFNVPAYFFMHTDWVDFIKHTTDMDLHQRDRLRRMLRQLYHQYDGVFVLNSDHRQWLTGQHMELHESRVHLTAHHAQPKKTGVPPIEKSSLFADASASTPILFIACRLSREKGIFDLPAIMHAAKKSIPDLKLVVAGTGPAEQALKQALPEAVFLGWADAYTLAACYSGLDLFIFPSRFDTFGNVILESFVHGMPAIAYNCKGPKDIIEHGQSGYLVESIEAMSQQIVSFYNTPDASRAAMSTHAIRRARDYQAVPIMSKFLRDLGLPTSNMSDAVNDTVTPTVPPTICDTAEKVVSL
ncbi:MAG: glycosyltransferase [Bermanella sp.]